MRVILSLAVLTLIFLLVLADFSLWNVFFGALISGGLMVFSRRLIFEYEPADRHILRRVVYFWPFAVATVWNIITGTVEVALITLHLRPLDSPGIVAVPIAGRTPVGVAVSADGHDAVSGYLPDRRGPREGCHAHTRHRRQ